MVSLPFIHRSGHGPVAEVGGGPQGSRCLAGRWETRKGKFPATAAWPSWRWDFDEFWWILMGFWWDLSGILMDDMAMRTVYNSNFTMVYGTQITIVNGIYKSIYDIWLWVNTYENTIFRGMNIHKSQLFWCELQGYKVLTHCHILTWPSLGNPKLATCDWINHSQNGILLGFTENPLLQDGNWVFLFLGAFFMVSSWIIEVNGNPQATCDENFMGFGKVCGPMEANDGSESNEKWM